MWLGREEVVRSGKAVVEGSLYRVNIYILHGCLQFVENVEIVSDSSTYMRLFGLPSIC